MNGTIEEKVSGMLLVPRALESVKFQKEERRMSDEAAKTITRYSCKRCSLVTELPGSSWFGMRLPPGWKKVNKAQLCSGCTRDYDREYSSFFSKFMSEGRKRK